MEFSSSTQEEPYFLKLGDETFPVLVTDDTGDQRIRVTIRCDRLKAEYQAHISESAAEILCSAVESSIDSREFRQWLVEQIKKEGTGQQTRFTIGKTNFIKQSLFKGSSAEVEKSASAFTGRCIFSELNEVLRVLGDQKTIHERQIWSGQVLYDSLSKGFEQLQALVNCFSDHDKTLQTAVTRIEELTLENKELKQDIHNLSLKTAERHETLKSTLTTEIDNMQRKVDSELKSISHEQQILALKIKELQAYENEQMNLWKKVHASQKSEIEFCKMESTKLRKTIEKMQVEKTNQTIRIKDTLRLLNEAQGRGTKQINAMRGELQYLRDMKAQQDANTQNLADLKDMYINLLPKIQQAYVSERRREAKDAVDQLQRFEVPSTMSSAPPRMSSPVSKIFSSSTPASVFSPHSSKTNAGMPASPLSKF